MPNAILRPNGDIVKEWMAFGGADHYDLLNEIVTQPDPGDNSDRIIASDFFCDPCCNDTFDMETTEISGVVSQVVIWTYGYRVGTSKPTVDIDIGSSWEGAQDLDLVNGVSTGDEEWTSNTFGGLSADQTDLNGLKVKFNFCPTGIEGCPISTMYAYITYELAAPASIDKVYGIESSTISKKYGTNWSDISKIYGIE